MVIPLVSLGLHWWIVQQPPTDSEKKYSLERQKYISERKRTIHTVYKGGLISQPFSNHKADSIEHVEINTKRKERRERPESDFRLTSSRRCPLRSSPSYGPPSSSPPFSWSIAPFLISSVPVLRMSSSTLRPRSLSSMFGIPIDAGSFPEVDFSGANITVPRRDGDGRSSAVGISLCYPMDFSALILYTQQEPVIVASSKVFGTTSVSPPPEYI